MVRVSGTEGYDREAPDLFEAYERISVEDVHRPVSHLIPKTPCRLLDIGAGTGRDAAGFAAMGHHVVAVEPVDELRHGAMALHRSPHIEWVADSLPHLVLMRARAETFDAVMLTAVWMHLDEQQRAQAMAPVASLVRPGGVLIMSLRHGPVPAGRRMFDVTGQETIELAKTQDLTCVVNALTASVQTGRPDVTWTRLAFRKR
jgi:SAM-dependent methyltransferase